MSLNEPTSVPTHWGPGSEIAGRFRVRSVLGLGGMGAVLEAESIALGHTVALKVLRREFVDNEEAKARFDQEARAISLLCTDHVVRVHDLGHTELGEPFIVMERLYGKTFDDLIEEPGYLALSHVIDLVTEASVGLSVAHAAGLVHRDVKPGNLFVAERSDGSNIVKVLDFGITKATRGDMLRLTTTATVFGTPLYMSPEQIMSAKNVDAATDQHALALVLFELLTKSPAYYDETPTAVTVKIATQPPPFARDRRADIPVDLDAILQRALAKAPGERFEDIAQFALALAPFGSERAVEAAKRAAAALNRPALTPTMPLKARAVSSNQETVAAWSTGRSDAPRARRSPALLMAASALLGLSVAGLGFWWFQASPKPESASSAAASDDAKRPMQETTAGAPVTNLHQAPIVGLADTAQSESDPPAVTSARANEPNAAGALPRVSVKPATAPKPPASAATARPIAPPDGGEFIPNYTQKKP